MDEIAEKSDFIRDIIREDLGKSGNSKKIYTRFPPEPNGYLHIGHAKAICLNFGIAEEFNGKCNLRFDDTNPTKEELEYVQSIKEDIKWLGFDWGPQEYYASDYFEKLFEFALILIKKGKAYICDLSADEIRSYRGTLTSPGMKSPYRDRSIEENLLLFGQMRDGLFADGERVLRAKIDMSSPNLNMRDPIMYRILHSSHHRSGDKWCIYPTYDWAHGQSDSIENITYSICTLEFEDHRPLYDWFIEALGIHHPRQIEFARLNLTYTVMSKRILLEMVEKKYVSGWDDPRMPTITGMRRRGYTPQAIHNFCMQIGVSKADSTIDMAFLEHFIREDLNKKTHRVMGVIKPLKVIIDNYPVGAQEELDAINNPEDIEAGTRKVPFSKTLYIEQDDFMEDPHPKFYRLSVGREVRLRYAYFIRCTEVIKDKDGKIVEIHCNYDPLTKGGDAPDGRKVKATIHWVSAERSIPAEVRLYANLFNNINPLKTEEGGNFKDNLNSDSLQTVKGCRLEPSLCRAKPGDTYQFERIGYFCVDPDCQNQETLIFNRIVTLKDDWAKIKTAG